MWRSGKPMWGWGRPVNEFGAAPGSLELKRGGFEFLPQDAHCVEVVQFACLEQPSTEDALRPKACAHVRGDGTTVVASDLERDTMQGQGVERVRKDGADSVAAVATSGDAKKDAQFATTRRISEVSKGNAADEFGVAGPYDCPRKSARIMAGALVPRRLRLGGQWLIAAHVAKRLWRVVPTTQRLEIGFVNGPKGD